MNTNLDFPIVLDGNPADTVMVQEFLDANSGPGVEPLEDADIEKIKALQPGQEHQIPVHAGWLRITRPFITQEEIQTVPSAN